MTLTDLCHPIHLWKRVEYRLLRPLWWNRLLANRLTTLAQEQFIAKCSWHGKISEYYMHFQEQSRFHFFFHPRNRKDFFLNTLTSIQSYDSILDDADDVLNNRFQTLGSPKVKLSEKINWQRDFKSGKEWPLQLLHTSDILDLNNPSDVKVPWELSRFHQVWWLGKAYWITGSERYAQKFYELVEDWIDNNPIGRGVNWSIAMEVAIRACNWIAGYYFFCESKFVPEEFWQKFLKSLYIHGRFIENNLEYSRNNGNHFLSDIVGLIFLGIFFKQTSFGKKWLTWAVRNLELEMENQVLADGVDYEKSVSYHRLVLELFYSAAILCKVNQVKLSNEFWQRLEKMLEFVQYYTRPDGTIPLWGDSDDGRLFRFQMNDNVNDHRHVLAVGAILFNRSDFKFAAVKFYQDALWFFGGEGFEKWQLLRDEPKSLMSRAFSNGGFYIMRAENVHLFIDAGELGLRGDGGHGHNDTLSFELWINCAPLIVDSGTYAYTFDPKARQEFRSTPAHNSVRVDREEIAEFNDLWTVKKDRTVPKVLKWDSTVAQDVLIAEHYGYSKLPQPVVHRRSLTLNKESKKIQIRDEFLGKGEHILEWRFHLAPSAIVQSTEGSKAVVTNEKIVSTIQKSDATWNVEDAWYSPTYGIRQHIQVLTCVLTTYIPYSVEINITSHENSAK